MLASQAHGLTPGPNFTLYAKLSHAKYHQHLTPPPSRIDSNAGASSSCPMRMDPCRFSAYLSLSTYRPLSTATLVPPVPTELNVDTCRSMCIFPHAITLSFPTLRFPKRNNCAQCFLSSPNLVCYLVFARSGTSHWTGMADGLRRHPTVLACWLTIATSEPHEELFVG